MTRRKFCAALPAAGLIPALGADPPVVLPVQVLIDGRARWTPGQVEGFWSRLWREAAAEFQHSGVQLAARKVEGEVRRTPGDRPIFHGAAPGAVNLVVTDLIPLLWDTGRGLAGVTTRYQGCDLCVIALTYAHANQVPFASLNTCVHELLHALLGDIDERNPAGAKGAAREFRVDWYATALWLGGGSATVREAARRYAGGRH